MQGRSASRFLYETRLPFLLARGITLAAGCGVRGSVLPSFMACERNACRVCPTMGVPMPGGCWICNPMCGRCRPPAYRSCTCAICGMLNIFPRQDVVRKEGLFCKRCGADLASEVVPKVVRCKYSGLVCAYPCGNSTSSHREFGNAVCEMNTPPDPRQPRQGPRMAAGNGRNSGTASTKGLSSFVLKVVAIVGMTCNHAAYVFAAAGRRSSMRARLLPCLRCWWRAVSS